MVEQATLLQLVSLFLHIPENRKVFYNMGERANGDDLSGAKVQDGREKTFILWSPDLARPWGWLGHGRRKGASFPFIAFSSFCVLVVG